MSSEFVLVAGSEVRRRCVEQWCDVEKTVNCWNKVKFLH